MLDSSEYSSEEKMIILDEAARFLRQNTDPKPSYYEAHKKIIGYLFSYGEKKSLVRNFGKENHLLPELFIGDSNTISQEHPERNIYGPSSKDNGKETIRPEIMPRNSIENLIRKALYKHLIIQTLLMSWILLILLIKIESISLFLSNPINQALLRISSAILSFIIYMMATK